MRSKRLARRPRGSARWSRAGLPINSSEATRRGNGASRKVLIHLAQTELALGTRVRFALTQPGYTAQPFSQDAWLPIDVTADARTALDVYTTLRRLNLAMFRSLTAEQRDRAFAHPEYGELTVGWVASQMAGHDIHHLKQLEPLR